MSFFFFFFTYNVFFGMDMMHSRRLFAALLVNNVTGLANASAVGLSRAPPRVALFRPSFFFAVGAAQRRAKPGQACCAPAMSTATQPRLSTLRGVWCLGGG